MVALLLNQVNTTQGIYVLSDPCSDIPTSDGPAILKRLKALNFDVHAVEVGLPGSEDDGDIYIRYNTLPSGPLPKTVAGLSAIHTKKPIIISAQASRLGDCPDRNDYGSALFPGVLVSSKLNVTSGLYVQKPGGERFMCFPLHGVADDLVVSHGGRAIGTITDKSEEVVDRALCKLNDGIEYHNDAADIGKIDSFGDYTKQAFVVWSGFKNGPTSGVILRKRDTEDGGAFWVVRVLQGVNPPEDGTCGAVAIEKDTTHCVGVYWLLVREEAKNKKTGEMEEVERSYLIRATKYFDGLQL